MGYHLAMKIKATRITFLLTGDETQWISRQDLTSWTESIMKASGKQTDAGHFDYQRAGLRITSDKDNEDVVKKVILDIPLPKSEINKSIRDAIFSLDSVAPMDVSVDDYTVNTDTFAKTNQRSLDGAYTVEADD